MGLAGQNQTHQSVKADLSTAASWSSLPRIRRKLWKRSKHASPITKKCRSQQCFCLSLEKELKLKIWMQVWRKQYCSYEFCYCICIFIIVKIFCDPKNQPKSFFCFSNFVSYYKIIRKTIHINVCFSREEGENYYNSYAALETKTKKKTFKQA